MKFHWDNWEILAAPRRHANGAYKGAVGRPWIIGRSLRRCVGTPMELTGVQQGCSGAPLDNWEIPAAPRRHANGAYRGAVRRPWIIGRSLPRRVGTPMELTGLQQGCSGAPLDNWEIPAAPRRHANGAYRGAVRRPWIIGRSLPRRVGTPMELTGLQQSTSINEIH